MYATAKTKKHCLKNALYKAVSIVLVALVGVFFYLYVKGSGGFIRRNEKLILISGFFVLAALSVIVTVITFDVKDFLPRFILFALVFCVFALIVLHLLRFFDFWEVFSSVDALRTYIAEKGVYAALFMLFLQFAQVVILPLPGVLTTSAAVLVFGVVKGALISFSGIFCGSVTAFFISRKLGAKVVSHIIGKGKADKIKRSFKGVDTVFLTTMFLLPFFPDDLLCFAAGLSSMSAKRFIITIALTRLISCFITSLSVGGKLVPYNTPQGVSVWIIILLVSATVSLSIYKKMSKKGEK